MNKMFKPIMIAAAFLAMIFFAPSAVAQATCDLYYQYEYSKEIVEGMEGETYIIEGMEQVDAFLAEVNELTGSAIPLGTADKLLGIVMDGELLLFGYLDGCQVGHSRVPWA